MTKHVIVSWHKLVFSFSSSFQLRLLHIHRHQIILSDLQIACRLLWNLTLLHYFVLYEVWLAESDYWSNPESAKEHKSHQFRYFPIDAPTRNSQYTLFLSIQPKATLRLKFMIKIDILEAYAQTEKYPSRPT